MKLLVGRLSFLLLLNLVVAEKWPYNRVYGDIKDSGGIVPNETNKEFEDWPDNLFVGWLRGVINHNNLTELEAAFANGTIPKDAQWIDDVKDRVDLPANFTPNPIKFKPSLPNSRVVEANQLFSHLGYPLEPACLVDYSYWWYRTSDGSCNWLKKGESMTGAIGSTKPRDYDQHHFADGVSKPRDGPNPRAVSNAFFKRKKRYFYEHTPLLLGMIEFIMHDVTYSQDSAQESIEVPMPPDEEDYQADTTFTVWRTMHVPGTGTNKSNPRELTNMATTWLDISALYGSTPEVVRKLRSRQGGKLLTQEVQARGTKSPASYLPFNTMDVPTNIVPGTDPSVLFAGGDPRTNEDWMLLGVHTLMLREHNRLCDIMAEKHPDWDDERIFQTVRIVMSAKYEMIANSYQMAYWTKEMPWPQDDGFPLYRQMYGENALEINPANTYPWPLVTKKGKPMTVSVEMSVLYRFHEFIISTFPIVDAANNTLWIQNLFDTGFNASGFIDTGLENVLRGMIGTTIPNFKSGVDEGFRSAGKYRGRPFDIATWSIVHEREQGLPTFNEYFRSYNEQDPFVKVPIRKTFESFSTDPEMVANLKRLYKTPDDVDFVVGVQLDEEMFPGTTVPKSALIVSLFSLFGMGNSDRFSVGFAMMRCLLVDKPWDCHPSNALEDLLWEAKDSKRYPDLRFYDKFWLTELDMPAHGRNLLWRLITENSEIKCLQRAPLFPANAKTNPILCSLPEEKPDLKFIGLSVVQLILALMSQHLVEILVLVVVATILVIVVFRKRRDGYPPTLDGWPLLGNALAFNNDPKALLLKGLHEYQPSTYASFGIKLGPLTHYLLTKPEDLQLITHDNPYEIKFNLHAFFKAINSWIVTRKENFDSDIHTQLVRTHLADPATLAGFADSMEEAAKQYVRLHPLVDGHSPKKHYDGLVDYSSRYITWVMSRCVVGPDRFNDEKLLDIFASFNDNAIKAMGLASLLPSWLRWLAAISINRNFNNIRKILLPVIKEKRKEKASKGPQSGFIDFIMDVVDNDDRVSDLVAVVVWLGLVNLQATFSSTILDIINQPGLQDEMASSLGSASLGNLDAFSRSPEWGLLRSATFESIRLSGPIAGPARVCLEDVVLRSDPSLRLPKGQVATLSAYYTHRQSDAWGARADKYDARRFVDADPPVGEPNFIIWGLKGPHTCPGRWFAVQAIQIMSKVLLDTYSFKQDRVLRDDEKYKYSSGNVMRIKVGVTVSRKPQV